MNIQKRRAIAYITGRIISKIESATVYDYTTLTSHSMSGEISDNSINVYDHDRLNTLTGTSTDGTNYSIVDYATNNHIKLEINNLHFSGYDQETSTNFKGSVVGKLVAFHDFEDSNDHNYSLSFEN